MGLPVDDVIFQTATISDNSQGARKIVAYILEADGISTNRVASHTKGRGSSNASHLKRAVVIVIHIDGNACRCVGNMEDNTLCYVHALRVSQIISFIFLLACNCSSSTRGVLIDISSESLPIDSNIRSSNHCLVFKCHRRGSRAVYTRIGLDTTCESSNLCICLDLEMRSRISRNPICQYRKIIIGFEVCVIDRDCEV